ncbi:hypothetical protein [Crocosphaera chwakensis]|uniref:Uncharacterized protein n=1 Tax=Crocosphaera chwakensis CCY0110 TaxID=391612 RepID=A3ITX6_9CHRO|nr:hypothetical protein [Crocosphaera chwakensis]EAZ90071.1 hypothetical protein CY0110_15035 [Crocosphaera chwakensis CCY0110]
MKDNAWKLLHSKPYNYCRPHEIIFYSRKEEKQYREDPEFREKTLQAAKEMFVQYSNLERLTIARGCNTLLVLNRKDV